jgi:hypothetical protein
MFHLLPLSLRSKFSLTLVPFYHQLSCLFIRLSLVAKTIHSFHNLTFLYSFSTAPCHPSPPSVNNPLLFTLVHPLSFVNQNHLNNLSTLTLSSFIHVLFDPPRPLTTCLKGQLGRTPFPLNLPSPPSPSLALSPSHLMSLPARGLSPHLTCTLILGALSLLTNWQCHHLRPPPPEPSTSPCTLPHQPCQHPSMPPSRSCEHCSHSLDL